MDRRTFIQAMGALSAAALLPTGASATQARYKLGLQLYSVNQDMKDNPAGTLAALVAMGYRDFETAGFDDKAGTFYGLKPARFKGLLDELQVTSTSGHFWLFPYLDKPNSELERAVDQCILGASALGSKYITWPWLAPEQRTVEHFKLLADKLNRIGEQVKAAGLGFAYHNHGFEFEDHKGENGFDIILNRTDPDLVKLQLDMYWVVHSASKSPRQLVAEQPGRYVMWHIKDMDKNTHDYTELGNGSIDYTSILPDPHASGLEYFYLEQGGNYTHTPLKSAATSANFFTQHLQHLL